MKVRGGKREGAGKPKPIQEKFRHRMITLPPELDDRLIKWSIETGKEISPLIQNLLMDYFKEQK